MAAVAELKDARGSAPDGSEATPGRGTLAALLLFLMPPLLPPVPLKNRGSQASTELGQKYSTFTARVSKREEFYL